MARRKPTTSTPDLSQLRGSQGQRRQRIVDEALALMYESEMENIHIREVADRAGVALGTAYRYFGSKDRLFAEAYRQWVYEHAAANEAALGRGTTNLQRTQIVAKGLFNDFSREPQFNRIYRVLATSEDPEVLEILNECVQRAQDLYASALVGVSDRQVRGVTFLLSGMVQSFADQVAAGVWDTREAAREVTNAVTTLFEFQGGEPAAAPRSTAARAKGQA